MKHLLIALSFLPCLGFAQSIPTTEWELKTEFATCPEMAGSSYYAYPGPKQNQYTPAPKGYEPVYISHYGRHGSRWITEDKRYQYVLDTLDHYGLSDFGKELRQRLEPVWQDAKGRSGELTKIGEQQHHDIAQRMMTNYPSLFTGKKYIRAYASTVRRCMMSMMAFCEGLKELNPELIIERSAYERDMDFVNYESPELKQLTNKKGEWYQQYLKYREQNMNPSRVMGLIFWRPEELGDPIGLMEELYWIAVNMQDTPLHHNFFDLFTNNELYNIWKVINYRMYVTNSGSVVGKGIPAASAQSLLDQIISSADEALKNGDTSATLRFGHDSALIRLLTRMKINGCNAVVDNPEELPFVWQDFRISPMAANLQIIFYQNKQRQTLVKFLLNENEVTLPIQSKVSPYYNWDDVKTFWK